MPKYNGINHLAMVTHDMDMTIRFWRDLLEMRLVAGLGKQGYRHYFFEIDEKNTLAFFKYNFFAAMESSNIKGKHRYKLKIVYSHNP